ncbi:hypothetical protein Tco_0072585 [Tanacetum coccineum]
MMIRRYSCLHSPKDNIGIRSILRYSRENQYAVFNNILEDIKHGLYSKKSPIRCIQLLDTPMDDPNMTMEEYIKFEEEKARRHGRVFDWQTATYGKIRVDDDLYDLRSMEAEFPAIIIDDAFEPQDALQCKSQVSTPVNDEIDFRISFDESDDEDYTIICDKDSFSYKMISVNNLKTDSENDNEKVVPSIPSPEPAISCFDDLDFFKDFENEFPAIVYNDAQTSKSDLLIEPILNPQHIDEFNLKDETSLSEYDEKEQNVLYFNDLFPFNVIHPDDLKSEKDNDNNEVDTVQSSVDMALPPREQRHRFLRYEGLEYTDSDIADFESMMAIEHRDEAGVVVFTSQGWRRLFDTRGPLLGGARRRLSWREFILALGLHIGEEMESPGFARYWSESERIIPGKGDLHDYWRDISTDGDFLGPPPSYTLIRDLVLRLCHRMMAHSIATRSQAPEKVIATDLFYLRRLDVGSFMGRLAQHFGLLTTEIIGGLTVIALELLMIDMAKLVRLHICVQLDDTWAWVAIGSERQPDATAGAPAVAKDAPAVNEGDQAIPKPVQLHPPPPAPTRTMP